LTILSGPAKDEVSLLIGASANDFVVLTMIAQVKSFSNQVVA
jgi:hypothetical protein